jgi:hypothetical protein
MIVRKASTNFRLMPRRADKLYIYSTDDIRGKAQKGWQPKRFAGDHV